MLSAVGGYFTNSYYRDTAFLAGSAMWSLCTRCSNANIDAGFMIGADLNGGYKGYSSVDPLMGAFQMRFTGANFTDPHYEALNHLGLALTVIPGQNFALNLALVVKG